MLLDDICTEDFLATIDSPKCIQDVDLNVGPQKIIEEGVMGSAHSSLEVPPSFGPTFGVVGLDSTLDQKFKIVP